LKTDKVAEEEGVELLVCLDKLAVFHNFAFFVIWLNVFSNDLFNVHRYFLFGHVEMLDESKNGFNEFSSAKAALERASIVTSGCSLEAKLDVCSRQGLFLFFCFLLSENDLHKNKEMNLRKAFIVSQKSCSLHIHKACLDHFPVVFDDF
jgi:hypothetical protein